jgi:ribosome recycling factor
MDGADIRKRMSGAVDVLIHDMRSIRTGRASSAMVEDIDVPAYGGAQMLKVRELASINANDPQSLVIEPWDKSIIGDIKKGIEAANVGFNPNIDGEKIRIVVPPMTGEDRAKYVKLLHTKIENARIAVRQVRGDEMKNIKNKFEEKDISEDERVRFEKDLQGLTDEFTTKIDELGKKKEEELLQV